MYGKTRRNKDKGAGTWSRLIIPSRYRLYLVNRLAGSREKFGKRKK
jgi:hypothetical protein